MLAAQIEGILEDKVRVRIRDGSAALREPNVMKVDVVGIPDGVTIVNLQRIGRLSGIRDGRWLRICDFLVICPAEGGSYRAFFVELKKTVSETNGLDQLRRSLPHLDYIRSLCRIEHGPAGRVEVRYALIGLRVGPSLAKQRVSTGHRLPSEAFRGITVHRMLAGTRLPFAWLARGEGQRVRPMSATWGGSHWSLIGVPLGSYSTPQAAFTRATERPAPRRTIPKAVRPPRDRDPIQGIPPWAVAQSMNDTLLLAEGMHRR